MKKIFINAGGIGAIIILSLIYRGSVHAVEPTMAKNNLRQEIKQEVKEDLKAGRVIKPTVTRKNILNEKASIGGGKITAKGVNTLTVDKDGKVYTVNIDAKTQLRRRFWGKATLDEMQAGDSVNVIGKFTDEAKTIIQALLVRDSSIQKRAGVFFGTVASVAGSTITVNTEKRGVQTLTVDAKTKYTNRKEQKIALADILTGHKLRFRGLWDNATNAVTEVTQVRDFSLPVIKNLTPTPVK
jgi:hypothetical protein